MRNPLARLFVAKPPAEEAYASQRLMEAQGRQWAQCNPSDLVGKQGLRIFSKMRKDDQIKAAMSFKKGSVLAPGWAIKSPEGMAEDWEPAAFLQWCLDNIAGTFEADLLEIMTAMEYGFSVTEKLFAPVMEGDWAGKIKLRELKTKDPATFELEADKFGTLTALYQIHGYQRVPLTIGKFVIWAYQGEFGNWYGESDLEAAYPAWWSKTNAYKWMAIALEKLAVPPMFALYNPGAYNDGLLAKLKTILARLQNNTTGQIPRPSKDDFEFWSPATTTAIKDVFVPALQMYNNDIARALLLPGLLGMTADADAGSYARSQTHFDAFTLVLDRIRHELAETVINEQIIRPLCDLNFPGLDDYPYFEFLPLTTDKRTEILTAWKQMLDARAVTKQTDDEEHIRDLLEFPERSEEKQVLPDTDVNSPASPAPPRGESSPDSDEGGSGRAFYSSFKLARTPNKYEKKVDFKAVVNQLNEFEQGAKDKIKASIRAAQEAVAKKIKTSFDRDPYALIEGLTFPNKSALKAAVNELVDGAFANGRRSIAPGKYRDALPGVEAKEAIKWLRAKKIDISGVLIDRVIGEVRAAITEAIRAGDTTQDAIERVKRILEPFTGDDAVLKDGEPLKPYRIETIVRTVTTQAYNIGRTVEIRQNPLVAGVQYSAILDERTTEVCAHLDGKIFRPGDSDLDALTPPNHFNSVPASTRIKTKRGDVAICDVVVGDMVMTHRGRWRPVACVMGKRSDHPVVRELLLSTGRRLRITNEHPVLTTAGWLDAGALKAGHVLAQYGENVPGHVEMGVFSPNDCPSLFDEVAVPYEVAFHAASPSLVAVDLEGDLDVGPSKIDHESIDYVLKNRAPVASKNVNRFAFGSRRLTPPRISASDGGPIRRAVGKVCVSAFHSLRMIGMDLACFFSEAIGPMRWAADMMFPGAVRYGHLIKSCPDHNAVSLTPIGQCRFPNAEFALNPANGLAPIPVEFGNQGLDSGSIAEVNHRDTPKWSGAAIITIAEVDNNETLWNLSVDEDESYLANDIIVHNCRSLLVPVMIDEEPKAEEFVNAGDVGKARDLAGKGFI